MSKKASKGAVKASNTIQAFLASKSPSSSSQNSTKQNLDASFTSNDDSVLHDDYASDATASSMKKRAAPKLPSSAPSPKKLPPKVAEDEKQWALDVGQKDTKHCNECGMFYSASSEADRQTHKIYHRTKLSAIKIKVSKTTQVLWSDPADPDRKIVSVTQDEAQKGHINDLLSVVDHDLHLEGYDMKTSPTERIFLYLDNGLGVGVIRCDRIHKAYRILEQALVDPSQDSKLDTSTASLNSTVESMDSINSAKSQSMMLCSKRSESATLGISRIWVRDDHKRQGIASTLFDIARTHFTYGSIIPKSACAMTQPTTEGREFGESYFGTKAFLVYDNIEGALRTSKQSSSST